LLFVDNFDSDNVLKIKDILLKYWLSSLSKHKMSGNEHALDLKSFKGAPDYLTKMANEMTLWHTKNSNGITDRFSPFQLANLMKNGDLWAKMKFLEYAEFIRGRYQLFWSKGLKSRFGITDLNDEQILNQAQPNSILHLSIVAEDYKKLYCNGYDYRPQLISAIRQGNKSVIENIVSACNIRVAPNSNLNLADSIKAWARIS